MGSGPAQTIPVGKRPISIAYGDGKFVVANSESDYVTMFNEDGTGKIVNIPVGNNPVAVAFSD